MPRGAYRAGILLLVLLFVGAQFHFCADLTSAPSSSHFCPVCSAASAALTTDALAIAIAPVTQRLESASSLVGVVTDFSPAISPRAPPASL
jgi:hypothetical protein